MPIDRRVLTGGAVFIACVAGIYVLAQTLPSGTTPLGIVTPLVEAAALGLTCVAFCWNRTSPYRWTWALLGLWLVANLFADSDWGWYELVLRTQPPTPSPADVGYLTAYPVAFATVVFATWKATGRLRAIEGALDATMFTLGAAGLAWPLLLAPLLDSPSPWLQNVINLAYLLGDLLVIIAFASLLLGSVQDRLPRFLVALWAAFLIQVVADSLYFVRVARAGSYESGGLLDSLWTLGYALAGVAALMGIYAGKEHGEAVAGDAAPVTPRSRPSTSTSGYARMLLPYLVLPLVGAMIWMQFTWYGSRWDSESQTLVYIGIGLVMLLIVRQFVTLLHNRRLNAGLSDLSGELADRVHVLADLSGRLEELNAHANHLNSLRSLPEVVQEGLALACTVTKCLGAWITLPAGDGGEQVTASFGKADELPKVGSTSPVIPAPGHRIQEVKLEARGEKIGTLWLLRPLAGDEGPDLVQAVGAHLATAIDNTRSYEELLRLAEKDPLTGLLNHGRIHERLAIEERRARQHGGCLSLVMMDLDDFKLLNDTYGHPAGDRVLAQVSEAIRKVLRRGDLAGRVGGDEMMLVLPDTDREGAVRLAERLRETLNSTPFIAGKGRDIPLRLSFGIATYPSDADSLAHLVRVADASLYASKQRGGDTISDARTGTQPQSEDHGLRAVANRLMDVVGARDHYTRRHADQVVLHALRLGQALGLSEGSLETLQLAAMLHDVGKLGVRDRLLRKPAPLTVEEEVAVRRHVDIGESIIRDLPRVAEVLEVVHSHHERHDGNGYPAGLAGDDIPLLARILSVADAYSAMVADRPYRRSLSRERAKAELLKAAGTQLDPELVQRFVQLLGEGSSAALAATG